MVRRAGISQEELRRANVSALLSWVHAHGPTSRAVLTTELGLNRSTSGSPHGACWIRSVRWRLRVGG